MYDRYSYIKLVGSLPTSTSKMFGIAVKSSEWVNEDFILLPKKLVREVSDKVSS